MKKTINVSLGGYAFTIEEDAYERLSRYLEGVKRRFASYPDASEIIDDIEARMGEKLMSQPGTGKILALPVIEALIAEMGDAEEIGQEKEDVPHQENPPRKLFRNPDDVIIAGVCSGLAAYFGIEPMWPRIVFALTVPFGGFGVVVYFILWMIVPQAKTNLEKAQMRGQPFNLDEFERNVKDRISKIRAEEGPHLKRAGEGLAGFLREVGQRIGQAIGALGKIFFKIIGGIVALSCSLGLAVVVFVAGTLLLNHDMAVGDIGILPFSFWTITLSTAALVIVVSVPLIFLILIGSSLLSGKNKLTRMVGFNLLALWVVGLIGATHVAIRYAPVIRERVEESRSHQENREYAEKDFRKISISSNHHVRIIKAESYSVSATGTKSDLDHLEITRENETLVIRDNGTWRECFLCWSNGVEITLSMPGIDAIEASGASTVDMEGFGGATLTAKLSGASRFTAKDSFSSLNAHLSGASRIEATAGMGDLTADLSGASRMDTGGGVVSLAKLRLSGASRVTLGTVDTLSVEASGASHVTYRNDPTIIKREVSGSASVEKDQSDDNDGTWDQDEVPEPSPPSANQPPRRPATGSGTVEQPRGAP